MNELNHHRKKRQYYSIVKSNTALNLPGITKMLASETQRKNNNSTYMDTLGTIGSTIEYEQKNTVYINKEQHKLKNILKKMNEDAMHMIDSVKPKKYGHKSTKQQISCLAEREINSSKKMISNLQYDIHLLKEQYVKIVDNHEEDQLIKKARLIKQQIEEIRGQNSGMKVSIHRGGNDIVREYGDLMDIKLNNLQSDNYLSNIKAEKLRSDHSKTIEQIKRIEIKLKEAQPKIQLLQKEWNESNLVFLDGQAIKNRESKYRERKYNLQSIKKKMSYQSNQQQYKYYKLLKELEYQNASCEAIDNKIEELGVRMTNSKYQLSNVDDQYREIKRRKKEKGKMVQEYLTNEKKNKSTYINQSPDVMPQFLADKQGLSEIIKPNQTQKISKHWLSQQFQQRSSNIKNEGGEHIENLVNQSLAQEQSNSAFQLKKQESLNDQNNIQKGHELNSYDIAATRSSKLSKNVANAQHLGLINNNSPQSSKNI